MLSTCHVTQDTACSGMYIACAVTQDTGVMIRFVTYITHLYIVTYITYLYIVTYITHLYNGYTYDRYIVWV